MSDLERAQAHLGCEQYQESPLVSNCWTHIPGGSRIADLTWPCSEATRLAALLAETRSEERARIITSIHDNRLTDVDLVLHLIEEGEKK